MRESLRRTAVVALGLTTICLMWIGEPLVDSAHSAIYHWSGPALSLFGAAFLDILIGWALAILLLRSTRTPGRWRVAVWSAVAFFTPLIAIKGLALMGIVRPSHRFTSALFSVALVALFLTIVLWRPTFQENFERGVGLISTVLAFVAIPGGILLCQLLWFGWQARSLNDPPPLRHRPVTTTIDTRPRIIWIVMDELSYQQVLGDRLSTLNLPAFDALAAQATVFTRIIPAGIPTDSDVRTEKILPSLLTGKPVDDMHATSSGQLVLHNPETDSWQDFEQHDTVFKDALDAGYKTAVAGWFNPYCRLMPAVVDHCFWSSSDAIENGMLPSGTVFSNMLQPRDIFTETTTLQHFFNLFLPVQELNIRDTTMHIADYQNLSKAGDDVLRDRSHRFVLLHLPIPHVRGIYNRMTGELTTGPSSYIDNLALADKYLSHARSMLEQDGQWDSSTIIIMGDHGWRTMLWRPLRDWSQEEERASHGGIFDDRPAYIVKLAGQQKGVVINTTFRAVETRKLMDALFAQKIRSTEDLSAWVQQAH